MFGEGPLTVTAHLIVYEDMFAHGSEHSDLKLSVEGQDIHVKRGVRCIEHVMSSPLVELGTVPSAELYSPP